ncbi:MAG: hypothetical protein C4329_03720 [Chitinophagaceae bacterium]
MKKCVLLLALISSFNSYAQNVVGYWYGTANVTNAGNVNNYLVELILKQNNGSVQGIVNYYFKNSFRSVQIRGNYNKGSRQLSLFNIPLTYFGSAANMDVDCPMNLTAQLREAKAGSNLIGKFVCSSANYRNVCPEVRFDLQLNKDASNQDSILTALRNFKEVHQYWTPSATDTAVAATIIQRPIVNYVVNNQYKQRQNIVQQEIVVNTDSVSVDFYDNGEIDGDSISVFFNDKLLASNQMLSTKSIHLNIHLDSTKEVNEITMFADNLGSIPPNTALMIVSDGVKRYEIRLSSNLEKNATLRIRRKKS